ncbi:division/cell wall cluster transcriptional repressor MraZ [Paralimibaculum aggregatum]|uniref:Transcriptional regulator MraZ n=1 Tax=Paralimibaculum aggregatum TaxID=3036245 RepID=A0ABQ6LG97_9RHOB|nr:division/cell wall cluster transcriptional repressor MraZ [Limibaculum sp. NKW23]
MFIGSAKHKVDAKGRVSLPSDYREVLSFHRCAEEFILVPAGRGDSHLGMTRVAHERLVSRVNQTKYKTPRQRQQARRRYIHEARPVSLEDGGRFVLSRELREELDLEGWVKFVGEGDTFEMWKPERYEEVHGPEDEEDAEPFEMDLTGLVDIE